jgi:L-alanine-DL-glutamate epimerase-like enolase superfamily enzyme
VPRAVPVCADESCHDAASLDKLVGRYDYVNLKLDKTGGLTGAMAAAARAEGLGLGLMVGCMVATSLSLAPAALLAGLARYADLDGPLLLERDREPGLRYDGSLLYPPGPGLWG